MSTAPTPAPATTKDRLLDEAERLYARRGLHRVTTREITAAAGQRNASAVTYHFGSRDGLLRALLSRRGGPIDWERGRLRDALGEDPALEQLVSCLVLPYVSPLERPEGRSYVQIVAQLTGTFATWRDESDPATSKHLTRILEEMAAQAPGTPALREERIVAVIMLLTSTVAARARRLDRGEPVPLPHDEFTANLIAMCTALLRA